MCFSASASFIAAGGLILGGRAIQKYRVVHGNQQLLAAIPFVFGAHQFSEGVVWLGVYGTVSPFLQTIAAYFYSFVAFVFWPIYIPLAISFFDRPKTSLCLSALTLTGFIVGTYYFWCLTFYAPLRLEVICQFNKCGSLAYAFQLPFFDSAINYAYALVTIFPFFITANQKLKGLVGPVILLSFAIGVYLSNAPEVPSVWCFFASIASLFIFLTFKAKNAMEITTPPDGITS